MRKLRLYLDTSIINFYFADDAAESMRATREFFDTHVIASEYAVFVSDLVLREIGKARDAAQRERLLEVIRRYSIEIIDSTPVLTEIEILSSAYIDSGIMPVRKVR